MPRPAPQRRFKSGDRPSNPSQQKARSAKRTPAGRPAGRPPSRPGGRPGNRPGTRPGSRPGGRPRRPPEPRQHPEGERLQKVLAAAGLGSRRQCEELITTGRVEVDRKVVMELGTRVDPAQQEIRVDGESLSVGRRVYYALNKPRGVVSTNRDPAARPRVIDLVPAHGARLFAVGRLDLNSEGLILLTNDGDLANRLTHPRYGVSKTYLVQVAGQPTSEVLEKLRRGIHLAEGFARAEEARVKSRHKDSSMLEMVLREGRNREVRRLLARVGHKVMRLTRTAVGPVRLGKLAPGEWRRLGHDEVEALKHATEEDRSQANPRSPEHPDD